MKRKIKLFLNGVTGARKPELEPKTNFSEKMQGHFLVVKLEGGYDEGTDTLVNESIEVIWADEAALMAAKPGTTVILG